VLLSLEAEDFGHCEADAECRQWPYVIKSSSTWSSSSATPLKPPVTSQNSFVASQPEIVFERGLSVSAYLPA
jgi:hypothetical protein